MKFAVRRGGNYGEEFVSATKVSLIIESFHHDHNRIKDTSFISHTCDMLLRRLAIFLSLILSRSDFLELQRE